MNRHTNPAHPVWNLIVYLGMPQCSLHCHNLAFPATYHADTARITSRALSNLAEVCYALLYPAQNLDFSSHAAAVQQDGSLGAGLVRLLAPAFQAAAIALQLPAEHRSSQHVAWSSRHVLSLAGVLSCNAVRAGLEVYLAADGPGIGRNALQVLQPACQLLSRVPLDLQAATPAKQTEVVFHCFWLVSVLSGLLARSINDQRQQGSWRWDARAQRACDLLLQLLPRAVPLLLWWEPLTGQGRSFSLEEAAGCMAHAMATWAELLEALWAPVDAAEPDPQVSLSAVAPWCAAASATLRSLAALAERTQQLDQTLAQTAEGLAAVAIAAVDQVTTALMEACVQRSSGSSLLGDELAQITAAIFQLHTTACRAAHFSPAAWQLGPDQTPLMPALNALMLAALDLTSSQCAAQHRHSLQPMAVGHCAAVLAWLGTPARVQELAATDADLCTYVACSLAAAMAVCPEAAVLDPSMHDLCCTLLNELFQVSSRAEGRS